VPSRRRADLSRSEALALEATAMVDEYERMLMDEEPQPRDDVEREYWLEPHLPYALRQRVETVFDVLAHLPLKQPLAVVSDGGKTIAANKALMELLGGKGADYVGRSWVDVMPGWAQRVPGFRREGEQVFEEHLRGADGEQHWVRVSLGPVAERGEQRAMAYLLFVNKPDVETIDHDEVRRLRKSLQLLAETQTDYVVEVDRAGVMTFVSPSFCRAVGAQEGELVGREFLTRVHEKDRPAAVAALDEAGKPPFIGAMRARLAADPRAELEWQIDAVIGEGIVGLDLVGRVADGEPPDAPAPDAGRETAAVPDPAAAPESSDDSRLAAIREHLATLDPSDPQSFMALARAVADAAGAECVLYNVQRGDAIESAVGWRLPPTA
jgi:PAS domain S-box-containing protein